MSYVTQIIREYAEGSDHLILIGHSAGAVLAYRIGLYLEEKYRQLSASSSIRCRVSKVSCCVFSEIEMDGFKPSEYQFRKLGLQNP
ncbi:hypothetical protein [Paenibacillus antarcticus]|uniref:hypothetical protein n=1 Tax=Paenibacillus antarcticus TaxID=253703 RepID=UPI001B802513|nr:hypothetical protein [Paenibacillus antarcticus]